MCMTQSYKIATRWNFLQYHVTTGPNCNIINNGCSVLMFRYGAYFYKHARCCHLFMAVYRADEIWHIVLS